MSKEFWDSRYTEGNTGWDIGYASPALVEYVLSTIPHETKILIPGAGRAYESEALFRKGYMNVHNLDISEHAMNEFLNRVEGFPKEQYLIGDFFQLDEQFDLVLEQTFFCAIDPSLRREYVNHMHRILNPGGKIAGVMFEMDKPEGPPFGGDRTEYIELFESMFDVLHMEPCRNSIEPRAGRELFVQLQKK